MLLPRISEPASGVSDSSVHSHDRPVGIALPHLVDATTASRQFNTVLAHRAGSDGYAEHMRTRIDAAHLHLSGMMATGPQCAGSGRPMTGGRTA